MERIKPTVLIVMDGFGITIPSKGNAISLARMPVLDSLIEKYPSSTIQASGELVGLPWGEMGNSEVGHLNIGAGRVMYQDLPRIDKAIADGSFFSNEIFIRAIEYLKEKKSSLHIMGLTSSGGVHSHINHLYALLELAKKHRLKKVFIHCFIDGRDTPSDSGIDFIHELVKKMKKFRVGKIASISGRYYALDRDDNWERIKKTYEAMALGAGESSDDPIKAVKNSYQNRVFDSEFIPIYIGKKGEPIGLVEKDDVCINFDYRADRARQISQVFTDSQFKYFDRKKDLSGLFFISLTDYGLDSNIKVAFPLFRVPNTLGEILSKNNLKQLRIAETEKYAHVTMFFNAGIINPFPGEDRAIIPSPAVESYDQRPEMSAYQVTERLLSIIHKYNFVLLNFANPDMLGHTGNIQATIQSLQHVDLCIGKIVAKVLSLDGQLIITADHGNADVMRNLQTGKITKDHTVNPVPIILVSEGLKKNSVDQKNINQLSVQTPAGVLSDLTVTALDLMNIEKPPEMTGISLVGII